MPTATKNMPTIKCNNNASILCSSKLVYIEALQLIDNLKLHKMLFYIMILGSFSGRRGLVGACAMPFQSFPAAALHWNAQNTRFSVENIIFLNVH